MPCPRLEGGVRALSSPTSQGKFSQWSGVRVDLSKGGECRLALESLRLEATNEGDHSISPRPCRLLRCREGNQLGSARNRRTDVSSLADFQVSLERAASVLGR